LRDVQISNFLKLFQILNGYPKPIAFLYLVSDNWPEKSGLGSRKKANAWADIHLSGFGYHPDIQNEFRENFRQIMANFRGRFALLINKDITYFLKLRKPLIRWRYLRFRARFDHHNILYGLIKNEIPIITFFIYTYIWFF